MVNMTNTTNTSRTEHLRGELCAIHPSCDGAEDDCRTERGTRPAPTPEPDPSDPLLGYSPDEIIVGPAGQTLEQAAADEQAEPYVASLTSALAWARTAEAGEYLVEYEDTGMTDAEDSGSRCGYDDAEIAEIRDMLWRRSLRLVADDRGLVAQAVRS